MQQPLCSEYSGQFHSTGPQVIGGTFSTGGNIHFSSDNVKNVNVTHNYSNADIDRACLRALQCPDSFKVKNRLKENKDRLLLQPIDWIYKDEQYVSWQDGQEVGLLWIKGGPGKGKTMMSIGLIEELSKRPRDTTVVTYFFCQNADYELNTIESIIKGLILQLLKRQESLKQCLRDRWDHAKQRFTEDVTAWRGLWNIFMDMLDYCDLSRVYIVIDAMDECRGDGMADLLKLIVRNGLDNPSQLKWLLTSRPMDVAERELFISSEQVRVSLELNAQHISRGVQTYVSQKVAELDRRWLYSTTQRHEIEQELLRKAEDTFLWVSLVCNILEHVAPTEVLPTLRSLPPELDALYHQGYLDLCSAPASDACIQLLKTMLLVYRPLNICEVSSIANLRDDRRWIEALIDRCHIFITIRGNFVEFVHQSARDYLAGSVGHSLPNFRIPLSHGEIAIRCLDFLSRHLKANILDLPLDVTRERVQSEKFESLLCLDYAATMWLQHLQAAKTSEIALQALNPGGIVERFFSTRFLQWLESLSLLDQLSCATEALRVVTSMLANSVSVTTVSHPKVSKNDRISVQARTHSTLSLFIKDAVRFLSRHFYILSNWPLQIYVSAPIFSPEASVVQRTSLDYIPPWLAGCQTIDRTWTPLLQTLVCRDYISSLLFSSASRQIALRSLSGSVKILDVIGGHVKPLDNYDSTWKGPLAFSPNGQMIATGSKSGVVRVYDVPTGQVATFEGHLDTVEAIAFSPDSRQLVIGSFDGVIKVYDLVGQEVQTFKVLGKVVAVTFSFHGRYIAAATLFGRLSLWDLKSGELRRRWRIKYYETPWKIEFSADGTAAVLSNSDEVLFWNVVTGNHFELPLPARGFAEFAPYQKTNVAVSHDATCIALGDDLGVLRVYNTVNQQWTILGRDESTITALTFSPDSMEIISASADGSVKIWDAIVDQVRITAAYHTQPVSQVLFSNSGKWIASGSEDNTVILWESSTGASKKIQADHTDWITSLAFSPNDQHLVSGSNDCTIKLCSVASGQLKRTLTGHTNGVCLAVFSTSGKQILSASFDKTLITWSIGSGMLKKTVVDRIDWTGTIVFSQDGRQLASASDEHTIKVSDVASGQLKSTLIGHTSDVLALAFSPNGRQIASASRDMTIKIWDNLITDCQHICDRTLKDIKVPGLVNRLRFSADGSCLVTNLGCFESAIGQPRRSEVVVRQNLRVHDQWIYYGSTALLRLPPHYTALCYDAHEDRIAIGSKTGHVLIFTIDRTKVPMTPISQSRYQRN